MALKEYLKKQSTRRKNTLRSLTKYPVMEELSKELALKFPVGGETLSDLDIQEILNMIVDGETDNWSNVSDKNWKRAARTLWREEDSLLNYPDSYKAYVDWLSSTEKRSSFTVLIASYLHAYKHELPETKTLLPKIIKEIGSWNNSLWNERHQTYHLFIAGKPHKKISKACLISPYNFQEIYSDAGLVGLMETSGLAKETYKEITFAVKNYLLSRNSDEELLIQRFINWSTDREVLRYPGSQYLFMNTLLEPWENRKIRKKIRKIIMDKMIALFKDPRMNLNEWHGVSSTAMLVMNQWLTKDSLEQFFSIVDETADVDQWEYRRTFWMAYLKEEYITEAWVAFAEDGFNLAKDTFKHKNYASLMGSGVQANHAVLIMKVGNLTIADWSHNGKCRIWNEDNPSAPTLYKNKYNRSGLVDNSDMLDVTLLGVAHHGGDRGNWQGKVSSYIYNQTGIRLNYNQYMP